jgi:hypothetical protein
MIDMDVVIAEVGSILDKTYKADDHTDEPFGDALRRSWLELRRRWQAAEERATTRVKPAYQAGHVSIDTDDWVALQTALREARERADRAEGMARLWKRAAREERRGRLEFVCQKVDLQSFHFEKGQPCEMVTQHPVFMLVAQFLYEAFHSCGGENYVEWQLTAQADDGHADPLSLTLQRRWGKTPAQKAAEAEEAAAAERTAREATEAGAAALREALEVWRVADDAVLLAQSHHVHPQSPEFSAAGDLVDAAAERLRTVLTASDAGNALLERLRTAERERDEAIARAERYSDALVGMIESADRREAEEASGD